MLPKANRLHQDKEIKRLAQTGKTFFLPQLIIKHSDNKEDAVKIGFVISTKVDKRAVVRNKLARRLREAVKKLLPRIKTGTSVLIIAKKQALELDFAQLEKQLDFAFSKIRIYNKD
ncbi:ribonuclease P protein component [Candidatus Parcubacteria bacterium]|jgi:ribonuclease P protein component|nr:ribonuclease P protein component [Candidatus Parcubacteria bacterium]